MYTLHWPTSVQVLTIFLALDSSQLQLHPPAGSNQHSSAADISHQLQVSAIRLRLQSLPTCHIVSWSATGTLASKLGQAGLFLVKIICEGSLRRVYVKPLCEDSLRRLDVETLCNERDIAYCGKPTFLCIPCTYCTCILFCELRVGYGEHAQPSVM